PHPRRTRSGVTSATRRPPGPRPSDANRSCHPLPATQRERRKSKGQQPQCSSAPERAVVHRAGSAGEFTRDAAKLAGRVTRTQSSRVVRFSAGGRRFVAVVTVVRGSRVVGGKGR